VVLVVASSLPFDDVRRRIAGFGISALKNVSDMDVTVGDDDDDDDERLCFRASGGGVRPPTMSWRGFSIGDATNGWCWWLCERP